MRVSFKERNDGPKVILMQFVNGGGTIWKPALQLAWTFSNKAEKLHRKVCHDTSRLQIRLLWGNPTKKTHMRKKRDLAESKLGKLSVGTMTHILSYCAIRKALELEKELTNHQKGMWGKRIKPIWMIQDSRREPE